MLDILDLISEDLVDGCLVKSFSHTGNFQIKLWMKILPIEESWNIR
jgi:hypothetical protein